MALSSIPETREQVVTAIAEIGKRERKRKLLMAAMNDQLAAIRERYEKEAHPHSDAIDLLTSGVHIWCEANRAELTQDGKTKTAKLASGKVSWRLRPAKVVMSGNIEEIIEALQAARLKRFLRIRLDVNKDAILADPKAVSKVAGIRIEKGLEDFVIVPFETELAER